MSLKWTFSEKSSFFIWLFEKYALYLQMKSNQ